MKYIKLSNLPDGEVTDVFVSCDINEDSLETMARYGVNAVKIPKHNILYDAVKSHPDMQVYHMGGDRACCENNTLTQVSKLFSTENICSGNRVEGEYPYDVAYNAARVGNYLICNKAYTAKEILKDAEINDIQVINVKQGYTKCNICIVSENAVITSDIGIKTALGNFPIDVLLVDDNAVKLKNFSHGFIGGATGKISYDKLAVNGNIKFHKNCDMIKAFAKKHSVEIISLNDDYIEDIGSILPILVK